ncbi:single-stranded-DNA-specific exonuclease RecJ [Bacillus alveayuensis]|uniref:single-stranded-DNA-specific exonuclease RecJ n=1 Tax=Aeribacillus alveayuensis TaxID=279215 RepID=UPI0005CCE7FC|nr:single-stranded-DNA-specific exonuclease RecJ [Bacillus alveayuensis]
MNWIPFDTPLENHPKKDLITYLARQFCIEPILMHHLYIHGLTNYEKMSKFFFHSMNDLHDPFLMNDMKKAIVRIIKALKQKEKIFIYGDYDVDGITSTTIMYKALKYFKADVHYRLPIRSEGYGLSPQAIEKVPNNVSLIITVDNGSSAHPAMEVAKRRGIDVIVTDHHEVLGPHPDCLAFINPKRHDNTYPFPHLSGAGVALKVVQALFMAGKFPWQKHICDLIEFAALGTIADLMPLEGENRTICKIGLYFMNCKPNHVLKKLFELLNIKHVDSSTIGFQIAPIFNSCGRIDDSNKAVDILINPSPTKEELYSLINLNKKRQQITKEQFQHIEKQIIENKWYKQNVIVVCDDFDNGIIGIIAAKIANKFKKPAIVISYTGTGSARSVNGTDFSIINVIKKCSHFLTKYGGHQAAAGLSIKLDFDHINAFKEAIQLAALDEPPLKPELKYISKIPLHQFPMHIFDDLSVLEPFGMAFPKPLFYCSPLAIKQFQAFGKNNDHLKLTANKKEAIAFFKGGYVTKLQAQSLAEFLYTPNCLTKRNFLIQDLRLVK